MEDTLRHTRFLKETTIQTGHLKDDTFMKDRKNHRGNGQNWPGIVSSFANEP
jgi:hypothetical protein